MASDKSFKKVAAQSSLRGQEKRKYLVSGKRVSLRLWENEPPHFKEPTKRSYETVGYVISGRAELKLGEQTITLEPGGSWFVPADAEHTYRILEAFTAIEATSPPAQLQGRDEGGTAPQA